MQLSLAAALPSQYVEQCYLHIQGLARREFPTFRYSFLCLREKIPTCGGYVQYANTMGYQKWCSEAFLKSHYLLCVRILREYGNWHHPSVWSPAQKMFSG